jgi:GT2 family glycosyltransferase
MLLSIIIVNYQSTADIQNCLRSASKFLMENQEIEWIVVDNDSKDGSEQILTNEFPFIQYIQMGYNAGFARANNAGIKIAKGDQVLLLNPDTLILAGSIEKCIERFVQSNHIACGVQLIHADGTPQFSGSKFVKGGLNHLMDLPYWGASLKFLASILQTTKPSIIKANKEQKVDWISGAYLMVKKWAIDKAGLMDEDFFLYAEEVEWCSRLGKLGTMCLYGDIEIVHLIGSSIQTATGSVDNSYTNLSDKKGLQLMVSNHLRIRKQYGAFWYMVQLLNFTWAIVYAFVMSFLLHLAHRKNPLTDFNKLIGFAKNVFTLWGFSSTMIAGKPYFYKCF